MQIGSDGGQEFGLRIAAELARQDGEQAAGRPSWRHLELAAHTRRASPEAEAELEAGS